jgi:hypothetical protein
VGPGVGMFLVCFFRSETLDAVAGMVHAVYVVGLDIVKTVLLAVE